MAIVAVGIFFTGRGGATALGGGTWYYSKQGGPRGPVYDQDSGDVGYLTSRDFTRNTFDQIMEASRSPGMSFYDAKSVDYSEQGDGFRSEGTCDGTKGQVVPDCVPDDTPEVVPRRESVRKEFNRRFEESRAPIFGFPIGESPGASGQPSPVVFPVSEPVGSNPSYSEAGIGASPQRPKSSYQLPEPWYQVQ
ncbi:MAG: hypothetical protein SWE60_01165 [Thermodesulfobacteriota bacterium]|nr:hypothetical protein [Thermodesulfobacteriota bacterium]